MEEIRCIFCDSENVYFSKKKQKYCCEDCEEEFELEKDDFVPQKVFISYGHDRNRELVNEIKRRLVERGHNPWIDSAEIEEGDNWRCEITDGVKGSNEFLAFVSEHSVRNPGVCLDEIAIALRRKECIIQSIILEKDICPPNSISCNQWFDLSDWAEVKEKGETVWSNWLDKKMEQLFKVIENPENIIRSGEISDIIQKLQPVTPQLTLKNLLGSDIVQREWLLETTKKWLEDDRKVFLLIGGPGTGKSIYSALMSNYLYNVAAVYFIEWKNADTQLARNLIFSIAFQIACAHKDYRTNLVHALAGIKLDMCSDLMLCDELIINPLSEMIDGNREKLVVIIDAIDELKENYEGEFLDVVERIIEMSPSWLYCIMTSRPEVGVLARLKKFNPYFLDSHSDDIREDILEFIGKYFDDQEIIETIYKKSGGSFAYVGELAKAVAGRRVSIDEINRMPDKISSLFYRNFERAIGNVYNATYYSILSVIVYAYEPLTVELIAGLLGRKISEVKDCLRPLHSYLHFEKINNDEYVSIGHKSLMDWLTGEDSGKYHIEQEEAHEIFVNYLVETFEKNEDFPPYMAKYAYDHIEHSKAGKKVSYSLRGQILERCIKCLKRYGFLADERRLLLVYKEAGYDEITWAKMELEYSVRADGETSKELCEFLYKKSEKEVDPRRRYEIRENVATAFFYLGEDMRSLEILMEEKEENGELFEDDEMKARWNHSISLPSHDMDYNEQVAKASKLSAELYAKKDMNYEYYVSLVNLFDAYMGCGRLELSQEYARKVFELNDNNYYVHIDDVLKICYANLLQVQGRIMESLKWYEEGLEQAKEIQAWDYLYGSVWRELAVAKFGDATCLKRLEEYIEKSKFQGFTYVVSLGECFYILSSWLLHKHDTERIKHYYDDLKNIGLAGHNLQAVAAMRLIGDETGSRIIDEEAAVCEIKKNINIAEGIKGLPEIIHYYFEKYPDTMGENEKKWYEKYILPVIQFREEYRSKLIKLRTDDESPYLRRTPCMGCEAKCCYDGVYLRNAKEEERISLLIKKYPESFMSIPEDYIVQGTWPGMEMYKKTAVKERDYKSGDFPAHFNKTTCVFSMENGDCLLQRVATDNQLHPWFAKPCACWSFPIRGISSNDGKIISPTEYGEMDPDYIDESYPGYATCLPCGKPLLSDCGEEDVKSWTELLGNEIEYFDYLIRSGEYN